MGFCKFVHLQCNISFFSKFLILICIQLTIVVIFTVMTYPAESVQIGYQNHVEDIRSFLDSRHADHYTVFNLSQRNYRGAKFSNRVSVTAEDEARMMFFAALTITMQSEVLFEGLSANVLSRLARCCY